LELGPGELAAGEHVLGETEFRFAQGPADDGADAHALRAGDEFAVDVDVQSAQRLITFGGRQLEACGGDAVLGLQRAGDQRAAIAQDGDGLAGGLRRGDDGEVAVVAAHGGAHGRAGLIGEAERVHRGGVQVRVARGEPCGGVGLIGIAVVVHGVEMEGEAEAWLGDAADTAILVRHEVDAEAGVGPVGGIAVDGDVIEAWDVEDRVRIGVHGGCEQKREGDDDQ
jgi:hypothetical protein